MATIGYHKTIRKNYSYCKSLPICLYSTARVSCSLTRNLGNAVRQTACSCGLCASAIKLSVFYVWWGSQMHGGFIENFQHSSIISYGAEILAIKNGKLYFPFLIATRGVGHDILNK